MVEGYEVRVFAPWPDGVEPWAMRVLRVQVRTDKVEDAAAICRDSIVPAVREQPGFRSALLAVDPTTGTMLSATVWNSKAIRSVSVARIMHPIGARPCIGVGRHNAVSE
jgi:hypothetical protein